MRNMGKMKKIFKTTMLSACLLMGLGSANAMSITDWAVKDQESIAVQKAIFELLKSQMQLSGEQMKYQDRGTYSLAQTIVRNENMQQEKKAVLSAMPTLEKCIAASKVGGTSLMNASKNRIENANQRTVSALSSNLSGSNLASLTNKEHRENLGTCTEFDVKAKRCGAIGDYAGASENMRTLTKSNSSKNMTLSKEDQQRADQFIVNSLLAEAPAVQDDDGSGASSATYEAKRKEWVSRMSAAQNWLLFMKSYHSEQPISDGNPYKSYWNTDLTRTKYKQLYGADAVFPENPSNAEIATFNLLSEMTGLEAQEKINKANELEIAKIIAERIGLLALEQNKANEILIHNTNINAMILANQLSPLDNDFSQLKSGN